MRSLRTGILLIGTFLAGCASIDYTPNGATAKTQAPVYKSFSIGANLDIPEGTLLKQAKVGGRDGFCTVAPLLRNIGSSRGGCLIDTRQSGYFDRFHALGSASIGDSMIPDFSVSYSLVDPLKLNLDEVASASEQAAAAREYCNSGPSALEVLGGGLVGVIMVESIRSTNCEKFYSR
jgi:hypothetical protein